MLAALGAGMAGLAGCGGGGDGEDATTTTTATDVPGLGENETDTTTTAATTTTESDQGLADVSGQTLRFVMGSNPEEITFLGFGGILNFYEEATYSEFPYAMWDAMNEREAFGRWDNSAYWGSPELDQTDYRLLEGVEFDRSSDVNTMTVTIKDDATWSDGTPITARDGAGSVAFWRFSGVRDTFLIDVEDANPWHAASDVRMPDGPDGKVYVVEDSQGYMDKFPDPAMLDWAVNWRFGVIAPTHIEPWKTIIDRSFENLQTAVDGGDWVVRNEIITDVVEPSHFEEWRDPETVVSSGAWKLSEIRGAQEIVLEPNEHFRLADEVNFDRVVYSYAESQERERAALQSGRLDYTFETLPQNLVQELPSEIEQVTTPGGTGRGLGFDHSDPHLGQRDVRAAIMYALDKEAIANNVHQSATRGITVPGGQMWARDSVASDQWVQNNLIDYSQDIERADSIMQNLGYSRQGEVWTDADGNQLQYQLPTTSDSPRYETAVAGGLTDWGIEVNVQTYDDATYQDKWEAGDFRLWTTPYGSAHLTGFYAGASEFWWDALNYNKELDSWNFFDQEAQEEVLEGYASNGWIAGQFRRWEPLEIMIPPVGQPDGELQAFKAPFQIGFNGTRSADTEEMHKKYLWTANWFLPSAPIFQRFNQLFLDTDHWQWPTEDYMWTYLSISIWPDWMVGSGMVTANPDNPEEGATVEN